MLEEFASRPEPQYSHPEVFDDLTTRERHIVSLVALGLTNGEIAQRLVVSPATVKTHVSRAMLKLHARDRAKLVALAYQTGFVQLPSDVGATPGSDDPTPPLSPN
jgi:DNA-binding NarL/FixJ family response regulator